MKLLAITTTRLTSEHTEDTEKTTQASLFLGALGALGGSCAFSGCAGVHR
jgi:hypothetical protein